MHCFGRCSSTAQRGTWGGDGLYQRKPAGTAMRCLHGSQETSPLVTIEVLQQAQAAAQRVLCLLEGTYWTDESVLASQLHSCHVPAPTTNKQEVTEWKDTAPEDQVCGGVLDSRAGSRGISHAPGTAARNGSSAEAAGLALQPPGEGTAPISPHVPAEQCTSRFGDVFGTIGDDNLSPIFPDSDVDATYMLFSSVYSLTPPSLQVDEVDCFAPDS
eukprot:jgi/Ulvmu1/535/UM001_0543.1